MLKKIGQYLLLFSLFTPLVLDLHFYQPYTSTKYFYFILILLLILAPLFYFLVSQKDWLKSSLVKVVLIFFIVSFFLSLFSLDFSRSFFGDWQRFDGLLYYIFYLIFFLALVIFLESKENWLKFLRTHALVLLATLIWAYGQYFSWPLFIDEQASRVYALIGNANFLAHYLVLSFYLIFFLAYFDKKFSKLYFALAALIMPAVLWTQSRGAFVSLAFTIFLLFIFYFFKVWQASKKKALALLFIFLVCALFASQTLSQRFTSYSWQDTTIETRLEAWQAAKDGFLDRPILGFGKNNFQTVFNKYLDIKIYKGSGTPMWFDKAHNQYFDYLAETGIIGLFVYLLFLAWPFIYFKKIKKNHGIEIALFIFAGLIANLIFLAFNFDTIASYPLYFIYLALIYKLRAKKETEIVQTEKLKQAKYFFLLGLCLAIVLVYRIFWPQLQANFLLKQVFLSADKQWTLSEWSGKLEQVYALTPYYVMDLSLVAAQSLEQLHWDLADKIIGTEILLYYSQTAGQQHPLDAKIHYLTANSALSLGTLTADRAYLQQAIDYYTNILPKLTVSNRPDLVYNLVSAYYHLSLLDLEQKNELEQKALKLLEDNFQRFPNISEAQTKLELLRSLLVQ